LDRIQAGYQEHLTKKTKSNDEAANPETDTEWFEPLTARQSLQELKIFLEHIDMDTNKTIFRSDHASNYLVLKGRLGRDKDKMLAQLNSVLDAPKEEDVYNLRPEWARGL
jgi:hypothetical protein